MPTLEGLFRYANIDDLYHEDHGNVVQLAFTVRDTINRFSVEAESLDVALAQAEEIVRRDLTLDRLVADGLTDDDIDRLSQTTAEMAEEAWQRGYAAGAHDADREAQLLDAELSAHDAYLRTVADQAPAMALAAEPVDRPIQPLGNALEDVLEQTAFEIVYDVERQPDTVGVPVLIQLPARIVLH